jgi:RNA polymerase sigma-70 factor, ECF subfamily
MGALTADTLRQGEANESSPCLEAVGGERRLQAEFALLVNRQSRFVYRIAYSVLRNVADAEDAVQETFLKLYRTGAWQGMTEEKAYLARVAWRVAVEWLPKKDMAAEDGVMEGLAAVGATPETNVIRSSEQVRLRELIAMLPEELRRPLVLSAIEEMTSSDVAKVMGIPEGTVRTRVMRARTELKRRFEAMREVRR